MIKSRWFAIGIALIAIAVGRFRTIRMLPDSSITDACQTPGIVSEIHEPLCIELTGNNYRWQVRYPGADGCLATEDDVLTVRHLHLPLETDVILLLKSRDYVYLLTLPDFGLKEIAVPELEFRMTFRPETVGHFALDGDELCGDPHPDLKGQLVVQTRGDFLAWLQEQRISIPEERPL